MAQIGPVVMSVAGDEFVDPARIAAIIWEGQTTSGDTVEVRSRVTNELIWPGRTDSTQTYLGATIPIEGVHAPHGFKLTQISAGRVLVYLREN